MLDTVIDLLNKVMPFAAMPMGLAFLVLVVLHAGKMLGYKPALKMVGAGLLIAYALEEFGVHTGIIYGRYYFTSMMGPKLDVIPIALVCLWILLLYLAYTITNLILDGSPVQTNFSVKRIIWGAVIGALIVTTIDLNADPFAAENGWWVWQDGGAYYGVPYHNFVGWFFVAFVSYIAHGFQLRREELPSLADATKGVRILSIAPVVIYAVATAAFLVINFNGQLGLITVYALGIPLLLAVYKWIEWYKMEKQND